MSVITVGMQLIICNRFLLLLFSKLFDPSFNKQISYIINILCPQIVQNSKTFSLLQLRKTENNLILQARNSVFFQILL